MAVIPAKAGIYIDGSRIKSGMTGGPCLCGLKAGSISAAGRYGNIWVMRNLKIGLVVFGMFLVFAGSARAMEGTANLGSVGGEMGSCFVASVYIEGRYRVLMTCRGLRSALDPVKNRYVAWVKKGENLKRLGEIVNGKLQASMSEDFEKIEITVEKDNYLNKPEGEVLLAGKMEGIELEGVEMPKEEIVIEKVVDEGQVSAGQKTSSISAAGRLKAFGKALLTGFGVLLLVVGVLSYSSRLRGRK